MSAARISRLYAGYAVLLLAAINVINYVDRSVIFVLFEPIKQDLGLSDAQLGWLGSAYVVVYALSAVPLGILSDLRSRRTVIAAGVTFWSSFTALGGLARNFGQLFVCRSMVGIGEASYTPAAQSLIADYFPQRGRALALGIFWGGLALGGILGIWVGGELEGLYGWRAAFLAVGIPGFILAMLAAQLRDPTHPRPHFPLLAQLHRFELGMWRVLKATWPIWTATLLGAVAAYLVNQVEGSADLDVAVFSGFTATGVAGFLALLVRRGLRYRHERRGEPREPHPRAQELVRAAGFVLRTPTLLWLFAGGALITFSMNGLVAWSPSYMHRELGLTPAVVGRTIGLWGLFAGVLGTVFGGRLGDTLAERWASGRVLAGSGGFLAGAPLAFWLLHVENLDLFIPIFFTTIFFFTWYHGPMTAAIFDVVPHQVGGSVIGTYVFFTHIAGDAIAYPLVGALSDRFGLRLAMYVLPAAAFLGGSIVLLATRTIGRDRERVQAGAGS